MADEIKDEGIHDATFRFRLAEPRYLEALADLRWRLCTDDLPVAESHERAAFMVAFRTALPNIEDRNRLVHFVAECDGELIAVLSIVKVTKIPRPGDINGQWGYLTNVYTLPEFRNMGAGGRLLATARNWAAAQQLELLIVWPSDQSYAFYERAGFRREADPLVLQICAEN